VRIRFGEPSGFLDQERISLNSPFKVRRLSTQAFIPRSARLAANSV
jgi:hypothetical protein